MASVHFLNVGQGDCTIIQHNSGRVSMVDICKGNLSPVDEYTSYVESLFEEINAPTSGGSGNFRMSAKPTNPLRYLDKLGVSSIFRFILTHPDMDHMDGFDALMDEFSVINYWDSGVRKAKPDFNSNAKYREEDWDRYRTVIEGRESDITVVTPRAGSQFRFANQNEDGNGGADGLHLLAPNPAIVADINKGGDVNDGSYVLLYRSGKSSIIIPGDAHDETWDYVLSNHSASVANCTVLFAPHHGRRSARNFEFLDVLRPRITFFGCAASGHLAYDAWSKRHLQVITNNQAGNIELQIEDSGIALYIENESFVRSKGQSNTLKSNLGNFFLGFLSTP